MRVEFEGFDPDQPVEEYGDDNPKAEKSKGKSVKEQKTLQKGGKCFTKVSSFVACLSVLQLFQVMGSGYGKSALTSIERRYNLSTSAIGLLQSCFHIGNLSVILFVSYYGSRWHRPRAIAIGSVVMAFSSVLSALPQFIGGRYLVSPQHKVASYVRRNASFPVNTMQPQDENHEILIQNLTLLLHENSNELYNKTLEKFGKFRSPEVMPTSNEYFNKSLKAYMSSQTVNSNLLEVSRRLSNEYQMRDRATSDLSSFSLQEVFDEDLCRHKEDERWTMLSKLTHSNDESTIESDDDTSLYAFIAVGSVIKGMGHTPLHPLGMSFIDDFASSRNSALYISMVSALSLVGPAVGFLLGSITTNLWVDTGWVNTDRLSFDTHDPRWVGAWWMGYLVTAALLLLVTIPLCMFPRKIAKEDVRGESGCCLCARLLCQEKHHVEYNEDEKSQLQVSGENLSKNSEIIQANTPPKLENSAGSRVIHGRLSDFTTKFSTNNKNLHQTSSLKQVASYCRSLTRSASAPVGNIQEKQLCFSHTFPLHDRAVHSSAAIRPLRTSVSDTSIEDFTFTLKHLLKDSVFMTITMGYVTLTAFIASSITYVAKYMESQFGLTASRANLFNGAVYLPMAVLGNLAGGLIIRRLDLNVKKTILLVLSGLSVTILSVLILFMVGCHGNSAVGFEEDKSSSCYRECRCPLRYHPVCDVNANVTYRSACFAGCKRVVINDDTKFYFECQCLAESHNQDDVTRRNTTALLRSGACVNEACDGNLFVFVLVMGVASMSTGLAATPSTLTILRVVKSADKAFAIGIVFVFTRVLAWIPTPVYVGSAIDRSCLQWNLLDDVRQQRCQVYAKHQLRRSFFGVIGLQLLCSAFFYGLSLYLVTRRHKGRGRLLHRDISTALGKTTTGDVSCKKNEATEV